MCASRSGLTSATEEPAAPRHTTAPSVRATYGLLALVLLFAGVLLLQGLGQAPMDGNKELRILSVITGMTHSGDYLIPRIGGAAHLTKPPLYYWAGCLAARLGDLPPQTAARLPSALCALILLAALFWFSRAVGPPELALPAVLALACFYEFMLNARIANFDMMLALFCFLAVSSFYKYLEARRPLWLVLTGLAATLALLTKATPALVMIYVPLLCLARARGELRLLKKPAVLLSCVVVPIILCGAWFVLMFKLAPEAAAVFKTESLQPLGVKGARPSANHYEPPWYFCYKIFKILFPACLLLPFLAARLVRTRLYKTEGTPLRWMAWGFILSFVIFSIIPQKQEAYLLPLLPYTAIMLAESLLVVRRDLFHERAALFAGGGFALIFTGFAVFFFCYYKVVAQVPLVAMALALACIGVAVMIGVFMRSRRLGALLVTAACAWWLAQGVYQRGFDVLDKQFKTGEIYKSPSYNKAHWDGLFKQHPPLAKIFKTAKRFEE